MAALPADRHAANRRDGGLPYHWPRPDPVVHDSEKGGIAAHQPYIGRLSRLGVAAAECGRGLEFIDQVSQLIWSGRVCGWDEGDHLERAAERAGLVWGELERALAQDEARLDGELERNAKDLETSGHWGVPTAVFEGEPFFGQDRLALLEWRMTKNGLEPRPS